MIEADELSQAISNTWDLITRSLGDDREQFECHLTTLLRELDGTRGPEQTAVLQSILQFFLKFAAAHKQLVRQIASDRSKGAGVPAGSVRKERYLAVPVFYGTDRSVVVGGHDAQRQLQRRTRRLRAWHCRGQHSR